MSKQFLKEDANTLKITSPVEVKEEVSTYQYQDLVAMRDALVNEKQTFNDSIDARITDAQTLVDAADDLGIVARIETVKSAESTI